MISRRSRSRFFAALTDRYGAARGLTAPFEGVLAVWVKAATNALINKALRYYRNGSGRDPGRLVPASEGTINDQIWSARMRAVRQVLLEVLLEVRGDRTRDVQP